MGQQQLLLLVLSTVIVGLATVAGIQAFSENQAQATQDALVQRAINIGNDVLAAHNEPTQFGGVNLNATSNAPDNSTVAEAAGYSTASGIEADGAGDNADCSISASTGTDATATVTCSSDGSGSNSPSNQFVQVTVDPDGNPKVEATSINESP